MRTAEFDAAQALARQFAANPLWDIERFQEVLWANGPCVFDNRRRLLPER
jgi:hypothetical protein